MEREPLRYCKYNGKVNFIRPFLMLNSMGLFYTYNVNGDIVKLNHS